ncbi:MAG: amino acid-binding protein [Planctomycetes bacterium]|nr:amino acid-binding protein [Planctomycetota bacterium]
MKLKQLSIFLENKSGQLVGPCRILADAGINILTLSLADTEQFGILRLITRDWEKAKELLQAAEVVVNVTEVVAIEVQDHPGGLADVLEVIESEGLGIEYMYAFTSQLGGKAVLVFRFEDVDAAIAALAETEVNILDSVTLYKQLEG